MLLLKAIVLGIVEGVTEFLPISSTGHLIVAAAAIDYPEATRSTFEIFIQLGAILAVVWNFRRELFGLVRSSTHDSTARDFLAKVLLAFVPAAGVGFLLHEPIERYLFSPTFVAVTLILGGILLIVLERRPWSFRVARLEHTTWQQAGWIGLAQVLSLLPGVSRAGATIVGAMGAGLDRPAATQFSFYLSIPTLCAASLYSLFKARHDIVAADAVSLGLGLAVAFVSALLVVRGFISFVQQHTFTAFGYYRIAAGVVILVLVRAAWL